jgi:hypothetical protein
MLALGALRVEQLKGSGFAKAAVYDPQGVGGTSVVTVLAHGDHPEWYDLPRDPHVPLAVRIWKRVLRPLGSLAIFGTVLAALAHYMTYGPKRPEETGGEGA